MGPFRQRTRIQVHNHIVSDPVGCTAHKWNVHIIGVGEGLKEAKQASAITSGECIGTWEDPGAESENLRVFLFLGVLGTRELGIADAKRKTFGAGLSGATLGEGSGEEANYLYKGSWVVTG